jgi:diacylglycerol kinase (ATP)
MKRFYLRGKKGCMKKYIGLISNICSGWNYRHIDKLEHLVNSNPGIIHQKVENFNQIPGALKLFSEYDIEFLVINGGDGTVHTVLTFLFLNNDFQEIPTIVLLKGGRANMLPNDIGLKGSPVRGLKKLLAWTQDDSSGLKFAKKNILRIEYTDQGQRIVYGMFLGTGLIYQAVKIYQKNIQRLRLPGGLNPLLTTLYVICLLLMRKKQYLKVMTTDLNFNKIFQVTEDNYFFFNHAE